MNCWTDSIAFIAARVDGTVIADYIYEQRQNKNAILTDHESKRGSFSTSSIRFNGRTGVILKGANDVHDFIWKKCRGSRAYIIKFKRIPALVCNMAFHHDGSLYAYSVGNDWAQGANEKKFESNCN